MKESQKDNIHQASQKFTEALKELLGGQARVGVFYIYLDDQENWNYGATGNLNRLEKLGSLEFLKEFQLEDDNYA